MDHLPASIAAVVACQSATVVVVVRIAALGTGLARADHDDKTWRCSAAATGKLRWLTAMQPDRQQPQQSYYRRRRSADRAAAAVQHPQQRPRRSNDDVSERARRRTLVRHLWVKPVLISPQSMSPFLHACALAMGTCVCLVSSLGRGP